MHTLLSALKIAALFAIIPISTTAYAGPDHAGGHMEHMNDVQKKLKKALGNKYYQPVPAATKKQLILGKTIFTKSCVACHGKKGNGKGPASATLKQKPADFTDAEHSKFYSDQGRIYIIKKGIKNTPMSGWENTFNEKEILSLHAYIRSLRTTKNVKKHNHSHGGHDH
ncbi:hypothetical protein MNBD_GAMMA07-1598 [hydrothermal vent metagenome]|uniref:Cytochrome c domain-containing protein n=1 Tax=hydrothermal vent metagenome TaxID=652676 RepID=A0A3B0XDB5_9ZZZZ